MTKPRGLFVICATISLAFVLALAVSAMAYRSDVSKATVPSVTTAPSGTTLAGNPPPPDDEEDGTNIKLAGNPPPPDDEEDGTNIRIAFVPSHLSLQ